MVKTKFMRMSCEERKKAKERYFATDEGSSLKTRVNRLVIYSVLLIAFGIYVIIDSINNNDTSLQLIYGIGLIIVAAILFIGRYFVIAKKVNDFLIEEGTKVTVKAEKKTTTKKSTKKTK